MASERFKLDCGPDHRYESFRFVGGIADNVLMSISVDTDGDPPVMVKIEDGEIYWSREMPNGATEFWHEASI